MLQSSFPQDRPQLRVSGRTVCLQHVLQERGDVSVLLGQLQRATFLPLELQLLAPKQGQALLQVMNGSSKTHDTKTLDKKS